MYRMFELITLNWTFRTFSNLKQTCRRTDKDRSIVINSQWQRRIRTSDLFIFTSSWQRIKIMTKWNAQIKWQMKCRTDQTVLSWKSNDYSNIWMLETFSNLKWTQGKVKIYGIFGFIFCKAQRLATILHIAIIIIANGFTQTLLMNE